MTTTQIKTSIETLKARIKATKSDYLKEVYTEQIGRLNHELTNRKKRKK